MEFKISHSYMIVSVGNRPPCVRTPVNKKAEAQLQGIYLKHSTVLLWISVFLHAKLSLFYLPPPARVDFILIEFKLACLQPVFILRARLSIQTVHVYQCIMSTLLFLIQEFAHSYVKSEFIHIIMKLTWLQDLRFPTWVKKTPNCLQRSGEFLLCFSSCFL